MIMLLFFLVNIVPCMSMQSPVKFCDEINHKMQQNIESICRAIPGNKFQDPTYKIYSQFGYDLKAQVKILLTYQEYQDIENMLNIFYTHIFPDLIQAYKINMAIPNNELNARNSIKCFMVTQLEKQTTLRFPPGIPNESDTTYISSLLSKNPNLLEKNHQIAFPYERQKFSLFINNESRDLKLTLFALAYTEKIIEQLKMRLSKLSTSKIEPEKLEDIINQHLPVRI